MPLVYNRLLIAALEKVSKPATVQNVPSRSYIVKTPFGKCFVNCKYEIPYLAGYSVDGKTIYIDKRLPRWFTPKSGLKVDIYKYLIVHEVWEKHLEAGTAKLTPLQKKKFLDWLDHKHLKKKGGYKYQYAHELATGKEREEVKKDGVDWKEYQKYVLGMVKKLKTFSGGLPKDLDVKPEKDTHDYYRLHKIEKLKKANSK